MKARMSRWCDACNEARFKPVTGGFVFQALRLAPFWVTPGKAYLVSETQKEELLARLRAKQFRIWRSLLICLLTFCFLAFFLGLFVLPSLHPKSPRLIAIAMIGAVVASAAPHLTAEARERKSLSAWLNLLPPAEEQITWQEANELYARAASFGWLAVQLLFFGALMLFAVLSAMELTGVERYFRLVLALAAALACIAQLRIIALKRRPRRGKL
jgi:hypothetical protein